MPEKQGEAYSLLLSPLQLFALFAAAVAIAIAASVTFGLRESATLLQREAIARNRVTAQMAAHAIQRHFDAMHAHAGAALASHTQLAAAVARRDLALAQTLLDALRPSQPHLDRLALTDPAGVLWVDSPPVPALRGHSFAHSPWYRPVQAAGRPILSPIYRRMTPPQIRVVAVASPLRAPDGRLLGYLVAQEGLTNLGQWLGSLHPSPQTRILLFDGNEQEVNAAEGSAPPEGWRTALRAARAGLAGERQVSGGALLNWAPVPGYGWSVLVYQPSADMLALAGSLRDSFIVFGLLVLAALLPLCYLVARALTRHQAARRHAQHLLSGVIEGSPDPIAAIDRHWRVLACNRAAAEGFHWRFGQALAVGDHALEAMAAHPEERERVQDRWQRVFEGESFVETDHYGNGEQRVYETRYYPLWDPQHHQPIAAAQMSRDITERQDTEQRIKDLNMQLVRHNADLLMANQELEHFSYSVSHDLRAPLRAIDGFTQMLAQRAAGRLDEEERRLLRVVRDNSRTMGQLIDDLLNISRVSRAEVCHNRVNMNLLVREVWQEVGANFRGEFDLDVLPTPPADHVLMRQLWRNLLSNAVKFSAGQEAPRVQVGGETMGDQCVFHVTDNGVGFDMRYASKLFGVFQRLHHASEFPGTGIGLAIASRIVHRHGGKIWAESDPGQGARFHFTLPCAPQQGEPPHG